MSKYRRLTLDELQNLEKEFVDFLVVNGIVAGDWVKMKATEPEKAEKIIELFSDVVMENVLRKIEFLELRTKRLLLTFQCLEEKIVMVGVEGEAPADFTNPGYIQNAFKGSFPNLQIFSTEKKYSKSREEELFKMLENGHTVADGKLFKALALSMADQ